MTQEQQGNPPVDYVLKLDADRRREIDEVKVRMENFLRSQINVENELKLVVQGQNSLKERFELGVSKTLFNLDKKFDTFMLQQGKREAEDSARDKAIHAATKLAEDTAKDMKKYMLWPTIMVCVSIFLAVLGYIIKGQ